MTGLPAFTSAMGPVIRSFGTGIGAAQRSLDFASLRVARAMGGLDPAAMSLPGGAAPDAAEGGTALRFPSGRTYNLLELGLRPTFYRFTEAVLELKMAVSTSLQIARIDPLKPEVKVAVKVGASGLGVRISTVCGTYSSRYQYASESSSRLRSKLASIPAPAPLEARLAAMTARARANGEAA